MRIFNALMGGIFTANLLAPFAFLESMVVLIVAGVLVVAVVIGLFLRPDVLDGISVN